VTRDLLERYREHQLAPHLGTPREAMMRRRYEETPVAEEFPSVIQLLMGDDEMIWAREFSADEREVQRG